jgi:hypothetical protein
MLPEPTLAGTHTPTPPYVPMKPRQLSRTKKAFLQPLTRKLTQTFLKQNQKQKETVHNERTNLVARPPEKAHIPPIFLHSLPFSGSQFLLLR